MFLGFEGRKEKKEREGREESKTAERRNAVALRLGTYSLVLLAVFMCHGWNLHLRGGIARTGDDGGGDDDSNTR